MTLPPAPQPEPDPEQVVQPAIYLPKAMGREANFALVDWFREVSALVRTLECEIAALAEENARLREELDDIQAAHIRVVGEACTAPNNVPPDHPDADKRVHCACIPTLREEIVRQRAELSGLRQDKERLASAIKWALGEKGQFALWPGADAKAPRFPGDGLKPRIGYFWWRTELRDRAFGLARSSPPPGAGDPA